MSGSPNRFELKNDRAGRREPPMQVHYQRLFRICSSFHITSLNPQLVACEQLIAQHDIIDIAIIRRFKAGKSSLLNHIAGRNLLPVDVIPVTAPITRLQAGAADRCIVCFQDGMQQPVQLENAVEYITEQQNPDNGSG